MSHGSRFNQSGLLRWHERLTGHIAQAPDGSQRREDKADGGMRGERAELKRVANSADVMLSPSFAALVAACYPGTLEGSGTPRGITSREIEALARTAMVLAHVDRCIAGRTLPEALAEGRDRPAVSEARVAALLRTQDVEDAARQIRMMIPMITGGVDPVHLHGSLADWERRRKEWAAAYHLIRLRSHRKTEDVA